MPRRNRCVLPGIAHHITQRGVNRCETFSGDEDRETYLRLLKQNLGDTGVSVLAWCLMSNHAHLVAVPAREDSLSVLFRRVHGRYAQYYNARTGRMGHLWQNRFFGCPLGHDHLWAALAYVERNPVRAGIVERAADYPWSSAVSHLTGHDEWAILDMEWWDREHPVDWEQMLNMASPESDAMLRRCTHSGRPFGDERFVKEIGERFGRHWTTGQDNTERALVSNQRDTDQFTLF